MNNVNSLYQQRLDDIIATTNHKEPKRVPIMASVSTWSLAYAKVKFKDVYNDKDKFSEAWSKFYKDIYFDATLLTGISTPMEILEVMGSKSYFVSKDEVTLQHKENAVMTPEDFPDLIEDPLEFIVNTLVPRKYPSLQKSRTEVYEILKQSLKAFIRWGDINKAAHETITGKYGIVPMMTGSKLYAPLDIIFDRLRGFRGTLIDLRRNREQVMAAVAALYPVYNKSALENIQGTFPFARSTLHCPTFLGPKDFREIFWPTYKQMLLGVNERGNKTLALFEGKWEQYFDYINELPKSALIASLEDDDIIKAKKIIGNTVTIVGGVSTNMLRHASKQECIDNAKKIIDECAPGGGFIFSMDKCLISEGDVNIQNLIAVNEFVHEYGKY